MKRQPWQSFERERERERRDAAIASTIPQDTFYLEVVNPLLASMEDLCPFTHTHI